MRDLNPEQMQDNARAEMIEHAKRKAARLLALLAPLFPVIASQTRSDPGAEIWTESWATQILNNRLTAEEIAIGMQNIAAVMNSVGNPPFSFPLFLQACRPTRSLSGSDFAARQKNLPAIRQDLLQNKSWVAARDRALAKIRGQGIPNCKDRHGGRSGPDQVDRSGHV